MDSLTDLFVIRGVRAFIRSDNGPEYVDQVLREWIGVVGTNDVRRTGFTAGEQQL